MATPANEQGISLGTRTHGRDIIQTRLLPDGTLCERVSRYMGTGTLRVGDIEIPGCSVSCETLRPVEDAHYLLPEPVSGVGRLDTAVWIEE